MSEMVERVAKAICCKGESCLRKDCYSKHFLDDAVLAVRAMREPADDMLQATTSFRFTDYTLQLWQTMVDEALKPSEGLHMPSKAEP